MIDAKAYVVVGKYREIALFTNHDEAYASALSVHGDLYEVDLLSDPRIANALRVLKALDRKLLIDPARSAREALAQFKAIDLEYVGVVFKEFDSPSEAAAHKPYMTLNGLAHPKERVWSYGADKALKLTIGDRVIVPVGDERGSWDERAATVVQLNAERYQEYSKNVIGRA